MNLEEEITIIQFGQGVHSDAELLAQFGELEADQKRRELFRFVLFLDPFKPVDADIDPAIANSGLEENDGPCVILRQDRLKVGLNYLINWRTVDYSKAYRLLLSLFKRAYQRCYATEQGNPANWWFWNLADDETVRRLRETYQALVDEIYADPGYQGELVSLARLRNAPFDEPDPQEKPHSSFVNYDELLTVYVRGQLNHQKRSDAVSALSHALTNALAKRYGIADSYARRVLWEVVSKYQQAIHDAEFI